MVVWLAGLATGRVIHFTRGVEWLRLDGRLVWRGGNFMQRVSYFYV